MYDQSKRNPARTTLIKAHCSHLPKSLNDAVRDSFCWLASSLPRTSDISVLKATLTYRPH